MKLKAIVPKRLLKSKDVEKAVAAAVNSSLEVIERDFKRTTRTWEHKVAFTVIKAGMNGGALEGAVGTDDDVFNFVDKGTKPHLILPNSAQALHFQTGYASKTSPNVVGSHTGGPSGGFVFADHVNHPGIEARNLSDEIIRRRQGMLESRVEQAILKVTGG
jgi:hypothetical protein